jgi:YesN/AraC family two-component response regulator
MITILLVEDEDNIRARFRRLLEETIGGVSVVGEASSGVEALEWLKKSAADAIITDIRMKDMNGLELIRRVRETHPRIPVVIVSGYSDFTFAKDAIRCEVTDYLLKPVDRVELAQVMEKVRRKLEDGRSSRQKPGPFPTESPQAAESEGGEREERQIIRKVKEIIRMRLHQDISLQYLADQVNLNHRYLSVLFKTETGQNLSDFVMQCRMDKAKELLRGTQLKVQDISRLAGYPNAKYFMTVFKQLVGVTPTEYRDCADGEDR